MDGEVPPGLGVEATRVRVTPGEPGAGVGNDLQTNPVDPEEVRLDGGEEVNETAGVQQPTYRLTSLHVLADVAEMTQMDDLVVGVVDHDRLRVGREDLVEPGDGAGGQCVLIVVAHVSELAEGDVIGHVTGRRVEQAFRITDLETPQIDPAIRRGLDVEVEFQSGRGHLDGSLIVALQQDSLTDEARATGGRPESLFGSGTVLNLRQVDRQQLVQVGVGQVVDGGNPETTQGRDLPDVQGSLGDAQGEIGIVETWLTDGPPLTGLALTHDDRGDHRLAAGDGVLGHRHPEGVLVVVSVQHAAATPSRGGRAREGANELVVEIEPGDGQVVVEDPNLVVADQPHETSMAGALVRGGDQAQALEEPPVMGGLDEGAFLARAEGLVQ